MLAGLVTALVLLGELGATFVEGGPAASSPGPPRPVILAPAASPAAPPAAPPTTSGALAPPVGYTAQQLIFDDQFSGTTLDTTKWTTSLGAQGDIWNDFGLLPTPYSGPNDLAHGGNGSDLEMYSPSQVSVDNGLTLTAQRNTNQWASIFPWISGVVTTEGKFTLPTGGWYVQVKAKMPDTGDGMWPSIWFMPAVADTPLNEIDGFEGGFTGYGPVNEVIHSSYFLNSVPLVQNEANTGVDLTAGYHVYGIEWKPGVSVTIYLDGKKVWEVTEAKVGSIPAEPYEIILSLPVAGPVTSSWRSFANATTPSSSMRIEEVQAYS